MTQDEYDRLFVGSLIKSQVPVSLYYIPQSSGLAVAAAEPGGVFHIRDMPMRSDGAFAGDFILVHHGTNYFAHALPERIKSNFKLLHPLQEPEGLHEDQETMNFVARCEIEAADWIAASFGEHVMHIQCCEGLGVKGSDTDPDFCAVQITSSKALELADLIIAKYRPLPAHKQVVEVTHEDGDAW